MPHKEAETKLRKLQKQFTRVLDYCSYMFECKGILIFQECKNKLVAGCNFFLYNSLVNRLTTKVWTKHNVSFIRLLTVLHKTIF